MIEAAFASLSTCAENGTSLSYWQFCFQMLVGDNGEVRPDKFDRLAYSRDHHCFAEGAVCGDLLNDPEQQLCYCEESVYVRVDRNGNPI